MKLSGESNVSCDRCLDKMILHFNQSYHNYIKFDHVEEEVIKDDVIYYLMKAMNTTLHLLFMRISC